MADAPCHRDEDIKLVTEAGGEGKIRGRAKPGRHVLQSELQAKSWLCRDPSAEEVRPRRCAKCGEKHGVGVRITGNGRRKRILKGPMGLDGEPTVTVVMGRRYECQKCGGAMFVVPREIAGRFRYTLRAMLLALAYWGLEGQSGGEVRERISPEPAEGFRDPRLWPSLQRWVSQRCELWPAVQVQPRATMRETARALVVALCARLSRAPPVAKSGDAWDAALCG